MAPKPPARPPVPRPNESVQAGRAPHANRGKLALGAAASIAVPAAFAFGGAAKGTIPYKKAAASLSADKKQALLRLAPARSALVKQKADAAKDLSPALQALKRARQAAQENVKSDVAQAKAATAPARAAATAKANLAKQALGNDKKAAVQALAPARSALVKQKSVLQGNAKTNAQPLTRLLGQAKQTAGTARRQETDRIKQLSSPVTADAKKAGAAVKQAAAADRKKAAAALAPTRSSLVRQKDLAGRKLKPVASTIERDMGGVKKGIKGLLGAGKQAVEGSEGAAAAKKAGQRAHQSLYGSP